MKVERAVLARSEGTPGPDGQPKLKLAESNVFKRGESVYLILVNVGKFKKGSDGKHQLDMDVEVSNASGKILLSRKNLLKNGGSMVLPDDIAKTPYGNVDTKTTTQAGTYVMNVTIYDKIGNAKVTRSAEFKLE
ncbi:MAG: hypothetical protein SFW36_09165 [Leptolyngbyaceae cyanobacterium bins.59]|nr:hypothetical protein [Leptolyngbyaceae cyanobacterium bins.59]